LQRSLSCLSRTAVWRVGPNLSADRNENFVLDISGGAVTLKRGRLPDLRLVATHEFEVIPDDKHRGDWKVRTLAYIYTIESAGGEELVEWHWHPLTTEDRPDPHMHVYGDDRGIGKALRKLHIPSGRVSFEQVVAFLFTDLEVEPARADWKKPLSESRSLFETHRRWA
jgi:hypothetical protein